MRNTNGTHGQYAHTFPEESFSLGVIGLNVISKYRVTLDFKERKIVYEEY